MTKKVKLAIAILATITSMNLNAQKKATTNSTTPTAESKSTKPTKKETMDWIGGKMKEYLVAPREFVSYDNGILTYKIASSVPKQLGAGRIEVIYVNTLDLNKLTGMSEEYASDFYIYGKNLLKVNWTVNGKPDNQSDEYVSISGPNYNDYPAPFGFKMDKILVERLRKAFATLMEYNSTQKEADEKF
ncbi:MULTISPECIES: hypothetical protein [Chryseobacterium]|uniref:hypothetical protein n=1 Tax=Chryseobacterium sp. R2A-55 TaxID=2744445 RepID=UPI001F442FEA|nr:hypothetical protein [Chryseobacterium sp. R2A-55]